jgi:hypothetical protein
MKTSLTPWLAPLLWVGALAATPENPELQRKFTWIDAADPAATAIRRVAEPVIQQTGNRMLGEVNRVLTQKGAEAGIDELHLKTWKLPVAVPGQPKVTAVKRTSLRVRNLANLPDNADLAALLSIQTAMADGNTPPSMLVQRVEAAAGAPAEWRVYRPMITNVACLVCHGPVDTLTPGVKAKLERLYPGDKATEYAANEWRGVIRVSIVASVEPTPPSKPNP